MATEQVTRNRTGVEPLETDPGIGMLATGSEPRNREPVGKKFPEPWNRRKKPPGPDQRTADRFQGTAPKLGTGPERLTRPNGSLEPKSEPYGSPGPAVLWNRSKN